MKRSQKEDFVSNLSKDINKSNILIITHYSGLNVKEIEDLRNKMREKNVTFKVTKNRLAKLAFKGTDFEKVVELLKGPTAVAYSEDSIEAAKIAVNYSKQNEKLKIIGGSYEGKLIDESTVNFLASLPSLDELRANLISLLQTPASKIVSLLQAPGSQLVRLANEYSKKTS